MTNTKLLLLISTEMVIILLARPSLSTFDIIDSPINPKHTQCTGSLVIVTKPGKEIRASSSRRYTSLNVKSAHIDGCGCFYVYKRPGFRSSARLIHPIMERVNDKYINFRIKSIEKIPCEDEKYWTIYSQWAMALKNDSLSDLELEDPSEHLKPKRVSIL